MEKDSQIKEKAKEKYGKIALFENSDSCCMPSSECCNTKEIDNNEFHYSLQQNQSAIVYQNLSIHPLSILGVGCDNPAKFTIVNVDTVVDLGSGAGIDVFFAASIVEDNVSHWNRHD